VSGSAVMGKAAHRDTGMRAMGEIWLFAKLWRTTSALFELRIADIQKIKGVEKTPYDHLKKVDDSWVAYIERNETPEKKRGVGRREICLNAYKGDQ